MSIDTSGWDNINREDPDGVGKAHMRAKRLFDQDPFVRMLAPEVRHALLDAFFSRQGVARPDGDHLAVASPDHARPYLNRVMAMAPLGFVTEQFKTHLVALVTFAMFPKPQDLPVAS